MKKSSEAKPVKRTQSAKRPKPKYNMFQNVCFMIRTAWTMEEKKVPILCLLLVVFSLALNLVDLYISPAILSAVERRVPVTELILTILGFVLAKMLLSAANVYTDTNKLYGRITVRMGIINLLNQKAMTTSYPNVDDDSFQKLQAKTIGAVESNGKATEAIWDTLTALVRDFFGLVIYVGLMTRLQPFLLAVILVTTFSGYFISNYLNGYGYRHRDETAECEKRLWYLLEEGRDTGVAKDIRIFGLRPWLEELYDKAMGIYVAFQAKEEGIYLWAGIVDLVLAFVRNAAAYAYLVRMVMENGLSVSEFLLYFTAVSGFAGWVSGILGGLNQLHRKSLDISTVRECIDYPEPFRFSDGEPVQTAADGRYEIRLEHVSFRYPGTEKEILTDVSLTLHPGEKLAVVGLNGAGKTTLVKLICGFLDPTEGRVLLNGKDIREFNRTEYYRMFSAVFQDFSLLAGTIALNVAQCEEGMDMERVKACLDMAGLRDRVESMPAGYETLLNREVYEDAVQLSGGETQRLMLARALYKDGPFILLDEPTAALDPIAESKLYERYQELTRGKTSVYISHRLASTRFCDRILMIENGGIVEMGTHRELLERGGKYAELYEIQSKYYKEGAVQNEEKE